MDNNSIKKGCLDCKFSRKPYEDDGRGNGQGCKLIEIALETNLNVLTDIKVNVREVLEDILQEKKYDCNVFDIDLEGKYEKEILETIKEIKNTNKEKLDKVLDLFYSDSSNCSYYKNEME